MKLGTIRKPAIEDFPEAPPWFEEFLNIHGQFQEQVTLALQRGLSFSDNTTSAFVTKRQVPHNSEIEIESPIKGRAIGLLPVKADAEVLAGWSWRHMSSGKIGVTVQYVDTTASDTVTFFVIGG